MKMYKIITVVFFFALAQNLWAGGEEDSGTALNGDIAKGDELFHSDLGCHVCHGAEAIGSIGPNIRDTITMEQVYHAVQNFPDMINWEFNNPELFEEKNLTDIVAYLQSLPREP